MWHLPEDPWKDGCHSCCPPWDQHDCGKGPRSTPDPAWTGPLTKLLYSLHSLSELLPGAPAKPSPGTCHHTTRYLGKDAQEIVEPKTTRPWTSRARPTPTDLLGVAHGLQDRVIQRLQGRQDVLVVSHVVHKVIWLGRARPGVTRDSAPPTRPPSPPLPLVASPSPGLLPSPCTPSGCCTAKHLPHSSLVSTWLGRGERERQQACPCPSWGHSCPPVNHAPRAPHPWGGSGSGGPCLPSPHLEAHRPQSERRH